MPSRPRIIGVVTAGNRGDARAWEALAGCDMAELRADTMLKGEAAEAALLPDLVRFDRADVTETPLAVMTLVDGLWNQVGVLPVPGPPKIVSEPARGPNGVGSATGLAELSLRDDDNDGLAELEMASGEWVEHDGSELTVVR